LGSGFSASTFVNAATKNIVISFEGTDMGSSSRHRDGRCQRQADMAS
jgi:hypothetical protein